VSAKSSKRIRHDSENSNQFSSDFQQIDVVHVVLFEKCLAPPTQTCSYGSGLWCGCPSLVSPPKDIRAGSAMTNQIKSSRDETRYLKSQQAKQCFWYFFFY